MHKPREILSIFGEKVRHFRNLLGISQEELGFRCQLDRTYISDIERGQRNISLINIFAIARALQVSPAHLLSDDFVVSSRDVPSYLLRQDVSFDCGFNVTGNMILAAATYTYEELLALPFSLFRSIDLKSLSGIVGALFATNIARECGAIVNPIEKGHPDVIPSEGENASEAELRNYGSGLEIKCTVGNVATGSDLSSGEKRVSYVTGITWQAHHRQVTSLLGLVIDFAGKQTSLGYYPIITAAFFTDQLQEDDWGAISGTTGRNTKVTGMLASGKSKMGQGWILFLDQDSIQQKYTRFLNGSSQMGLGFR